MGALDGPMENFGPFDDAMGKLETLNKAMGKLGVGRLNDLMGKQEIGPFMAQWNIWGPFDDAMGKLQTRRAMGKLGPSDNLMGKLEALDHELFSNGLIRLHCTLLNLWAKFNWEILDDMQAEKEYMGSQFPLFVSYFKDCVMIINQCLILVFSVNHYS